MSLKVKPLTFFNINVYIYYRFQLDFEIAEKNSIKNEEVYKQNNSGLSLYDSENEDNDIDKDVNIVENGEKLLIYSDNELEYIIWKQEFIFQNNKTFKLDINNDGKRRYDSCWIKFTKAHHQNTGLASFFVLFWIIKKNFKTSKNGEKVIRV